MLFHGPEAALVRFWGGGNSNENESKELPLKSIAAAAWATPPRATASDIRVPSHERTLHRQVIAGLFGRYKNWRRAADPTFASNVYRAGYTNENSAFLADNFNMLETVIVCAYPNNIKKMHSSRPRIRASLFKIRLLWREPSWDPLPLLQPS